MMGLFNMINRKWQKIDWSKCIDIQNEFELTDLTLQNEITSIK